MVPAQSKPSWREILRVVIDPSSGVRRERDRYREALEEIQKIAAREWQADETNYEWYGDIAGIAEEVLGIDIWSPAASREVRS